MAAGGHLGSPIWAILDDRKSLSIAFLAISDQYTTFLIYFSKWPPAAIFEVRFAPKTIGFFHYVSSMAMPNMKLIGEFVTQLEMPHLLFEHFYTKWPPEAILFFRLMTKIMGFLQSGTSMAMANMNLIGVFVTKLWPVQALACGGGGDGGATKT